MARHRRFLAVAMSLILAPSLVGAGVAPTAEGDDAEGTEEQAPVVNPLDLAVPYLGELETKFAEGWTLTNCADLVVPEPVQFTCEPEVMTFSTESFDEDFGTVLLAAVMSNADELLTVHYSLTLALPAVPSGAELDINMPVSAGTPLFLTHSQLGILCEGCREQNARIESLGVEPAAAGALLVTDTHLVFASDPDYRGEVTLSYRVQDERDQWSEPIPVTAVVSSPGRAVVQPLHLLAAMPRSSDSVEFASDELVVTADKDDTLQIIGCGTAVFGTVTCIDDTVRYTAPLEPAAADQFTVTLLSASGEQVRASVTVSAEGPESDYTLVTGRLVESVVSMLATPLPPDEDTAAAAPSVFTPFIELLQRRREP